MNRVDHWFYWMKCFLVKRYNTITVRRLPPTWIDRDSFLEHVVFQIVEEFVEKEEPFGAVHTRDAMLNHISWLLSPDDHGPNYRQYDTSKEIIEIYHWIKTEFARYEDRLNDLYSLLEYDDGADSILFRFRDTVAVVERQPFLEFDGRGYGVYDMINDEEDYQRERITEMLGRIVKIRAALWT